MTYQLELDLFCEKVKNNCENSQLIFTTNKLEKGLKELLINVQIEEVQSAFYLSIPTTKRKVYEEFKKLLPLFEGRWDRAKNIHVCRNNPQIIIDEIINKGLLPDSNPYDFFPTPRAIVKHELFPALNLKLFDYNGLPYFLFEKEQGESLTFFDPSAGDGALLLPFIEKYPLAKFFACEIDNGRRTKLESNPSIQVIGSDFLDVKITQEFDFVVMNPPFRDVIRNNSNAWINHIKKAFSLVSWRGSLASVVPETCFISERQQIVDFRNWVLSFGDVWQLPANAFKKTGTNIQTRVISLKKEDELGINRMWEASEGYPSRFTYMLCLGLDNDRTVHDARQKLESWNGTESKLCEQLDALVCEFVVSAMRQDVNYFFNDRVRLESTQWLHSQLCTK